ncbi:MAG: hypothetical protein H6772_03070 [Pseudomonadales bacterium]|nr:hypothetical protein [Pseudomonadales bacterium]
MNNDQLQKILDNFKHELQEYIKLEVDRRMSANSTLNVGEDDALDGIDPLYFKSENSSLSQKSNFSFDGLDFEDSDFAVKKPNVTSYDGPEILDESSTSLIDDYSTNSAGNDASSAGNNTSSAGNNTNSAGNDASSAGNDADSAGNDADSAGNDADSAEDKGKDSSAIKNQDFLLSNLKMYLDNIKRTKNLKT